MPRFFRRVNRRRPAVCSVPGRPLAMEALEPRALLTSAPVITPGSMTLTPATLLEGTTVAGISGSFTDADASDTHTVSIDWGDGHTTSGTVGGSGTVSIRLDYMYDTNNFFGGDTGPARRALLQAVADSIVEHFNDSLLAITPGGSNTWSAKFKNPATGEEQIITNPTIAANELVIYAGGRDIPGSTLGIGGPGGFSASGTSGWLNTVSQRGQGTTSGGSATDFGPWGGSITFDTGANWWFGGFGDTSGLAGKNDFLSVAAHELTHALGFGTADSFTRLVSGGTFTGTQAIAEYGSAPPVTGGSHWAEGTMDGGQEAAMDPSITVGQRKLMTALDFAALDDLGWSYVAGAGTFSGTHTYADNGNYTISVTVSDPSLTSTAATLGASVTNVAPTLTISSDGAVDEGALLTLLLEHTDPGDDAITSWDIDWGDGNTDTYSGASPTPTHTYAADGKYTISATATDEDGTFSSNTFKQTVNNVLPDLTATLDAALPDPVAPGANVSVDVHVVNAGSGPATGTIALKLYASTDQTLVTTGSSADKLLATLTGQAISLAPAGDTTLNIPFTVPAGLFGSYTLFAVVDSASALAESNESNNTASAADALRVSGAFGNVAGKANVKLTVTDADGTLVTFALTGAGLGTIARVGDAYDVVVTGATKTSNVAVTTAKSKTPGDDGAVDLRNITVGDPENLADATRLGKFTAATADLAGSVTVTGSLASLQLRNIADNHLITLGSPASATDSVTLLFASVANLSIQSATPIKALTASQWLDDDLDADVITAPWIGSITTTGNKADPTNTGAFQAGLALSGAGAPKNVTLAKATLAGTLSGAAWTITGSAGSISAGATAESFTASISGDLTTLTTTKGDLSGAFVMNSLNSLKVKANLQNAALSLQSSAAAGTSVLKSASASGMFASSIKAAASLGSLTFNQMAGSTIFAGVSGLVASGTLPDNASQVTAAAAITNLTIKGIPAQAAAVSFSGSVVAAGTIKKISLKVVDTGGTGDPYGIAGDTIQSITRTGGSPITNKTTPETLDPQGNYRVVVL